MDAEILDGPNGAEAHPHPTTPEAETSLLPASTGLTISLNAGWQVSEDELQWLLQRYQGGRWRDRSFCRTREALLRCIREYCGKVHPVGLMQVEALLEWHA